MFWFNLASMIIFCIAICMVSFGEPFDSILRSIWLIGGLSALVSTIATLHARHKHWRTLKAQAVLNALPDFATRLAALRDTFQEIYDLLYPDPTKRPIAGIGWCPPTVAPVVAVPPEPIYFLAGIPPPPEMFSTDRVAELSHKLELNKSFLKCVQEARHRQGQEVMNLYRDEALLNSSVTKEN